MRQFRHFWLLAALAALAPACGPGNNSKPPNTISAAPTNLVATAVTTARIDLTWTPGSTNEFEFRIERSDDNGVTYSQIGTVPRGSTAYSDLGLIANTLYDYRVTAWNSAGNSPYAGPATVTTNSLTWYTSPTPGTLGIRADHSAIYDSLRSRMILFGGLDDFFSFYNDVWALDLLPDKATMIASNHWTQLTPTGTPPSTRFGHSAIYDAQNDRMIVFGGQDSTPAPNQLKNDVYVLPLSTLVWSKVTPSGTPPSPRMGHTAVYDSANQRMVIFGGNDVVGTGETADCFFLSLPSSAPFVWSSASVGPLKRTEHVAIYDGFRQQMIIFGGLDHSPQADGSDLNGETWSLKLIGGQGWSFLSFASTPGLRQGHSAVYDSANQRMVMFGGDTKFAPGPSSSNELWALRLDGTPTWLIQNPTSGSNPSARYGHTAVYDSGNRRMVVFGGYDDSGFPTFSDTALTEY